MVGGDTDLTRTRPGTVEEVCSAVLNELEHVRAELRGLRERIDVLEGTSRRGVTREEAEKVGSPFWAIVSQAKGPDMVVPVVTAPGFKDAKGDGVISYRFERTDRETSQGPEIWRTIEEIFFTKEEAEAPPGRRASRTTGRQLR